MSLSPEWDGQYRGGYKVVGTEPYFEKHIISFVSSAERILELGAGTGNNIPFIVSKYGSTAYRGIEGSQAAVDYVRNEFPGIEERIVCGDFCEAIDFDCQFDAVVERAAVTHNDTEAIKRALDNVWNALKPGGIFVSSDWFSINHSEYERGELVDTNTRTGYTDGQFVGIGKVHFSSESELRFLFDRFERVHLQERVINRVAAGVFLERVIHRNWISPAFAGVDYRSATWDIVARRPQ